MPDLSRRSILGSAGAAALASLIPWRPRPQDIVIASEADVPEHLGTYRDCRTLRKTVVENIRLPAGAASVVVHTIGSNGSCHQVVMRPEVLEEATSIELVLRTWSDWQ